ncbi:hypothetical protein B484DRAFT_392074 [Ochromonadaceae sp. CCMP2298]|nr:hypothetical protein B484DRAFT_392074 [Ochromonadaceae sp. CCMP2298]
MHPIYLVLILLLVLNVELSGSISTGFWYNAGERPPNNMYETVPYANMTVRVNRPFTDGPGQDLVKDPFNPNIDLFVGPTINRQTFDSQFILDMSYALGISPDRVYVLFVSKGTVHFSWESNFVNVNFIFLERNSTAEITLLEAIADLTQQIQIPSSKLYQGTNVTSEVDSQWGLEVLTWDVSVQLTYAIDIIGKTAVKDGYYLNQGSLGICDLNTLLNGTELTPEYCEFERFFEDDVARALNITYSRVQVLFIKSSAIDAVLVHFRLLPPDGTTEVNVTMAIGDLIIQVSNLDSELYKGNVTIRTDSTWGVNKFLPTPRQRQAKFTLKYYEYDPSRLLKPSRLSLITAYDRCKANRRCNWGIVEHDQASNDARFFLRLFDRGTLFETNMFLDFEDWRMGSRGFSWTGYIPPTALGATSVPMARSPAGFIRGAHFWPFDQASLGPDIPCYLTERNQGLVLDRSLQRLQIDKQEALVDDLQGRIDWLGENIEDANMGPVLRSRKDVRSNLTWVQADFTYWWQNEVDELRQLNSSMCIALNCSIQFNTTSLLLTGAIEGVGEVALTKAGTEVALFSFNSIYLGPEVAVTVVGQRALSLISKTTMVINTTIEAAPGTLGGFQGGGSVARYFQDALSDTPRAIYICDLGDYCDYSGNVTVTASAAERANITSNNVNGPGSGNLRVNAFVVRTFAQYVQEVQVIQSAARLGQTITGGFTLQYKTYTTPIVPHDVTPKVLKRILEENLNLVPPSSTNVYANRDLTTGAKLAGVGLVNVTRSGADSQEGFTWKITYTTAVGNVGQIGVTSFLGGLEASVNASTEVEGNQIGGTFQLEFQGVKTTAIPATVSATGLVAVLEALPMVSTAFATRNDPTDNCDDGLCPNGPFTSGALLWTVYITTDGNYDNTSPTSPTSPLAQQQGPHWKVIPHFDGLTGTNATVGVFSSTAQSLESPNDLLNVSIPFSLAFGGAGGSYGGAGGTGYGINPVGPLYNDQQMDDLLGGSGGCMRSVNPFDINSALGATTGSGGHGGGAIELIAANDLTIGSNGKIIFKGGDANQTAQGGGGGGSGGAILLTTGTTLLIEGELDASGGKGGYGGTVALAGGGGGGGRIASYAESITVTGTVQLQGGACGVLKTPVPREVLELSITVYMIMVSPLNNARLAALGVQFVEAALAPAFIDVVSIEQQAGRNDTIHALLNTTVLVYQTEEYLNASFYNATAYFVSTYQHLLDEAVGVNLAQVVMVAASIDSFSELSIEPVEDVASTCSNSGSAGTFYTEAKMTTKMYVATTDAAESTKRALFLSNRETTNTTSGSAREAPFSANGPMVPFEASRPSRVTYYTRTDAVEGESAKTDYGTLFALISRGESGLNVSNVIGVFSGSTIMHGANFGSTVDEKVFLKRFVTIDNYPILSRWYKIDIKIQWDNHTYSVSIDDTIVAVTQPFKGDDVDGIRVSMYRSVDVWFDEIYVGFDNSLEFQCPITLRTGTNTQAPVQRHWSATEVSGQESQGITQYNTMTRHYNFLDTQGSIAFDGQGQVSDNQDIKIQSADGDYPYTQGLVHAGALVYLTNSLRSGKAPLEQSKTLVSEQGLWSGVQDGPEGAGDGRQFWYTEYNFESVLSSTLNGGVAACSSQDLTNWRFEGIVFHYANLSDEVFGTQGPFYVERPKVLFNAPTNNYVMWAVMDNDERSLAQSAIATSPYEDGPFLFRRSFYPDGNKTRDQVIFVNDEGLPLLARTYFQTVEFLLPEALMQPIWESAKSREGVINYRSNFHRAFYEENYDNFNDIYNQRWRKEDISYKVICENKITGVQRDVPSGVYNAAGNICDDPEEKKITIGQGNPIVRTVFISPNDSDNSWWRPTSVPAVLAQAWSSNYRDGYCGVRKLNDDYDINDPNLADFVPVARNTCSNIADNPIHPTLQDKLIGLTKVVTTRRAKFISISALTFDYLDTNGWLNTFEGELESGDLISMIVEMGQFGFSPGADIKSTFRAPVRSSFETAIDFRIRYSQFIQNVNDRATYSLACVLDGICPVNFRDQLTEGHF